MLNPKMTVMAIGARTSLPSPMPIAIGNKPKVVVRVVIMIGRKRDCAASLIAVSLSIPSWRNMSRAFS